MQPISYRSRPVAIASEERVWLTEDIEALPAGHALKTWVCFMCLYARDVLTEALPGPYTDDDAERFARAALISERQFAANSERGDHALAILFNVPLEQIAKRRRDPLVAGI